MSPISGYLVVDPGRFNHQWQATQLAERIHLHNGWPHPDGARWVLSVESPASTRERWIADGWPEDAVGIAF